MFQSVRARLTLWYTAILALVLIAFSGISYALLGRAIHNETDGALQETARSFATNFSADPRDVAEAPESLRQYRYHGGEVLLLSATGEILASSPRQFSDAERREIVAALRRVRGGLRTVPGGPELDGIRVASQPFSSGGDTYVIGVARDLDEQADRLERAAGSVLLGIPLALLVAAGGGYLLARKSLAPVTAMSLKARQIGAATLGERIAVQNPRDELGFLGNTLNDLLERLQTAFESQKRFMSDASHELRTPIAIIQGEADVVLARDDRDAGEYRESLAIIGKSATRLTRIVENLFLLARTDAGSYPVAKTRLDLDEEIGDCMRALRSIAAAQNIELTSDVPPESFVIADRELLQRLLVNLIDNAVKFSDGGGRVHVAVGRAADMYEIRVSDSGSGIAADDVARVFDRFFRGERARSSSGAGLGLPIARWIAEVHGGRLDVERSDARGTTFLATLPAAVY